MKFQVGDLVSKPSGYAFDGTIVAVFENLSGEVRVVAELTTANGKGMLHIFSEAQLDLRLVPDPAKGSSGDVFGSIPAGSTFSNGNSQRDG